MSGVVVLGCLEETIDTLSYLEFLGGRVDAIVTLPQQEAARARSTNWFDLRPYAATRGIALHEVETYAMKSEADLRLFERIDPVAVFVVGWQRLVPGEILALARHGSYGFHGSSNLLPWGRGRSPINWSIIEGRDRFILHMFRLAPGVDDGDIVGLEIYDIRPADTCRSVYYKTAMAQARLMARYAEAILDDRAPAQPQIGTEFHYPKRTPEDGRIDWTAPASEICRLVRAVTRPYPGAFARLNGESVMVWRAEDFGDNLLTAHAAPGEIVFASANGTGEVVVQSGRGAVLLLDYDAPSTLTPGKRFDV
jgi:methionyl-tRNA formyltransferase